VANRSYPLAVARVQRLGELVGPHRRGGADVSDLAAPHGVVERGQRLLDRRVVVPPVELVQVDRLHAQPIEAVFELLFDRLPREPAGVRVRLGHLEVRLRGDDALLAVALQRLAEDALRLAVRVHVGGVEEVHPEFERALDDRFPLLLVEDPLAPIRVAEAHTAETDLRDRRPVLPSVVYSIWRAAGK